MSLKSIFHLLESIQSARIEGNHTTVIDIISNNQEDKTLDIKEIENIENTLSYVDDNIKGSKIDKRFILDIHSLILKGMNNNYKGGVYRDVNVSIKNSNHTPPSHLKVDELMSELIEFINKVHKSQYDLIKIAQAHHGFMAIHPFRDGNGRCGRVLTYSMLIKSGFDIGSTNRILNPTAIFCGNRDAYYEELQKADSGDMNSFCTYFLEGLKNEFEKINRLVKVEYVKSNILNWSLKNALDYQDISLDEYEILKLCIDKGHFKAVDVKQIVMGNNDTISRKIRVLLEKNMIRPHKEGGRIYLMRLHPNRLTPHVFRALQKEGFAQGIKI